MAEVTVVITASQTVDYRQYKTMTRAEWEEIKRMSERQIESSDGPLSSWLDLTDVRGGGDFEGVEMYVIGDDGKPMEPPDEYEADRD